LRIAVLKLTGALEKNIKGELSVNIHVKLKDIIEEMEIQIPFEQLEQSLKKLLAQPHNVHTKTMSRRESEQKEITIKTIVNLLPASLSEVRIVQIHNIDEQACGGTHVNNTTEIGDFSIVKIQNKGALKRRIKIQLH
jgi:alanyl-tRNA synthetase/misacylated tRNA(Ala) deacylase